MGLDREISGSRVCIFTLNRQLDRLGCSGRKTETNNLFEFVI